MIKIYDDLEHTLKVFKPIQKSQVKMYLCGPTVYDYIHIGNARTFCIFDVIFRFFEYCDYNVNYIINITDIDDKIINKAHDLKKSEKEVADYFSQTFLKDLNELNIAFPTRFVYVTEVLPEIITFIEKLIAKNCAYLANGNVYFNTACLSDYGVLSNRSNAELNKSVREIVTTEKRNNADFAIWKKTTVGQRWPSPFGEGRPGWHTECVAIINKFLGQIIDIHGGGMDLLFPHHENEIAQQKCFTNTALSHYWMHAGQLLIEAKKMSKSLQNFIYVHELFKTSTTNEIRWLFYFNHYRKPMHYSENLLNQAKREIQKITDLRKRFYEIFTNLDIPLIKDQNFLNKFIAYMENDFNLPNVMSLINELLTELNRSLNTWIHHSKLNNNDSWETGRKINFQEICAKFNSLEQILEILGFKKD